MPLTANDKNNIALATTFLFGIDAGRFTQESLQRRNPVISILFGTGPADLLAALNPIVPRGPDITDILRLTRPLLRRGLQTRSTRDPFFGSTVISTVDQAPFLDELVFSAAQRRVAATQDFSSIGRVREALVEGLAQTASDRGFRSSIDPNLRGGVFRETAESPLQFIEGDFL